LTPTGEEGLLCGVHLNTSTCATAMALGPTVEDVVPPRPASYDKKVGLVLQGGGALGSYQAGVYEALSTSEYLPDWVAGISIGAINAAIIAGNAPEKRVERLRALKLVGKRDVVIGNDAVAAPVTRPQVRG
jgi:predicted acylesterase/phospholipase RssA